MTPRVHVATRRSRRARLLALQQRLAGARMTRRVGSAVTVMIDGRDAAGYAARTAGSAWEVDGGVRIEEEGGPARRPRAPGSLARVRVTGATPYDLFGHFETAGSALPIVGGRS
jgi:tRNA A37 methylthiotransferase MiaB